VENSNITVGVISDTHGLLRQEAVDALQGSDYIIHAGDIGKQSIIDKLSEIAPVSAVRGNTDKGDLATTFPHDDVLQINDVYIYTIHIIDDIDLDPTAAGFQVVVYGHSHKPEIKEKHGVIYLNPGSAGPRRFPLPVTVAKLTIQDSRVIAKLIELEV